MAKPSKKEEDAAYLQKTANEAQFWWLRTMQKSVDSYSGGSASSKAQLELRESLKREEQLRAALETKDTELQQLQNSSRAQITQLHKALVAAKKDHDELKRKALEQGPPAVPMSVSKLSAGAAEEKSCLSGLRAMLQKKPSERAIADAAAPTAAPANNQALQKALVVAQDDAAKLHAAFATAKELHVETCQSLEAKVATLQEERNHLADELVEEGKKSASRAEAFKRLQQQTSTERSRDAELMDDQKAQIRQLMLDLSSLRTDLDNKCDEVKRLEEGHQAALRQLMDEPRSADTDSGQLGTVAQKIQQETAMLRELSSKAQEQLNQNRSPEAMNALFERMDDNHDGIISPQEFEAHRAEYERVIAENNRLAQDLELLAALQEQVSTLDAECTRLQSQESHLQAENEHLNFIKDQAKELSANYEQLLVENESLRQEHRRMLDSSQVAAPAALPAQPSGEVDALKEANMRLQEEVESLTSTLDAQGTTIAGLQEEIAAHSAADKTAALDQALQEKIAEISHLKVEKLDLQKEVDALTAGMEESIAINERLQQQVQASASLPRQDAPPPAALEQMSAEYERLEREVAMLAGELEDSRAANLRLQEQLGGSAVEREGSASDSMQENFMLRAENNRLEKELEVLTVTCDDHQAECESLRRELAGLAADRRADKDRHETDLARQLQEHEHVVAQFHRDLALAHSSADEKQDTRRAELSQALRESSEELDKLMAKIAEQQLEIDGLREDNRVLERVRDQANVLTSEFDTQQVEAERQRIENNSLAAENRQLQLRVQDAQSEMAAAQILVEDYKAAAMVKPWFNRSGATYIGRVDVDFLQLAEAAAPTMEANQTRREDMAAKIENGETVQTAMQRYRLGESERAASASGELEWNNNGLFDFVQAVFLQYGLVPPDEPLVYDIYRMFDLDPRGYLAAEEAVCLADATLRATFVADSAMRPQDDGNMAALQQLIIDRQQQVEDLESQLLQMESKLRRAEIRATAAERERDAIERVRPPVEDALSGSRGSRTSVRTSPEKAVAYAGMPYAGGCIAPAAPVAPVAPVMVATAEPGIVVTKFAAEACVPAAAAAAAAAASDKNTRANTPQGAQQQYLT
eukprot:CAMPEP_0178392204 /NCGR_PEP_ID=MMETSP0689_2-20121128/11560_1 /TAXON_ID=160604 /ORGANISM="Amphidinium massartii, Strain CS-259" /LENGTH=1104 /DNA_ID=CAMNT_0020012775 /DNA_START=6 /DNA_END=3319 /DNA_ORIENTATION=+